MTTTGFYLRTLFAFLGSLVLLTGSAWGEILDARHFTFGYWLNGWRQYENDASPDILCLETGHYGLTFDVADLTRATYGEFDDSIGYAAALSAGPQRLVGLAPAELAIEVESGGKVYRAVTCKAGADRDVKQLKHTRLWESGRLVQHFDLLGLVLQDEAGKRLACDATLNIVVWPRSFALTLSVEPTGATPALVDAKLRLRLKGSGRDWLLEKPLPGTWRRGHKEALTLTCDVETEPRGREGVSVHLTTADNQQVRAAFDPMLNGHVARVDDIKRRWRTGYTDVRHYDDVVVRVDNAGKNTVKVPFLFHLRDTSNITGLCPILCDASGVPTGIPVQLSKNWHYMKMGAYLRAYALLPAAPGRSIYRLRVVYGFYGSVPSASHAQLSLVGYGGHGRWDQLAIGCWGETICLDMDQSCVANVITDVRALMVRNGSRGQKWNWTDAGWGGDWLHVEDAHGEKLTFSEMKTAYLAHGPCLSEVRYDGSYGSKREVDVSSTVRTLRTDDYARTFQTLRYRFNANVAVGDGWLFRMGHHNYVITPQVAYGHRGGIIDEKRIVPGMEEGSLLVDRGTLSGAGPWWVAFPGATPGTGFRRWGTGSRALIVRGYRAKFGGRECSSPSISLPLHRARLGKAPGVTLSLVPQKGVAAYQPGDTVEMDLEWITLPRVADDYYGPNSAFRQHLAQNPSSWKTVHREVAGNDLKVNVSGGVLLNRYPIIIRAQSDTVTVDIEGGVGFVPIRFEGLKSATGYVLSRKVGNQLTPLDQSVHGNDFWQTDYDAASKTYKLTYNLPLDGLQKSTWVLGR